ncbi:hypothetical protein [Chengkuizengella marina]|uniref:Intracellular proteinase inhibitor BsuPI domain-containing protein n=1 Tax=Chengkuizengella marina TaxID=2507566 RepID=A0A6N9PXB3_9BACL|nr:hypothetical protein [Chengkuizengella marina]NBI28141.1 hypothetical protein [Chengkuizengella marina]
MGKINYIILILILLCLFLSVLFLINFNSNSCEGNSDDEIYLKETVNEFEMQIYSQKCEYKSDEVLNIVASLKYVGSNDSITIHHADKLIRFNVYKSNGDVVFEPLLLLSIESTTLKKDIPISMNIYGNEEVENIENISLPSGAYKISAISEFSQSDEQYEIPINFNIYID